jgi:hypothetical protein
MSLTGARAVSISHAMLGGKHEFIGSCHENLALGQTEVGRTLGSSSSRGRCSPLLQRFSSEDAEGVAGNKMALNVERVVDGGLYR